MARSTRRVAPIPSFLILLLSLTLVASPTEALPVEPVGDLLANSTGTLTDPLDPVLDPITGTLPDPLDPSLVDKDCKDFDSQLEAQTAFLAAGGPALDPLGLDLDGDGVACEWLPGPFSDDTTPSDPSPDGSATTTGGAGTTSGGSTTSATTLRQRARVLSVIDGDTIRVRLANGRRKAVQLIGIDAPEVRGTAECGGKRAAASMRRLAPRGIRVVLVSDSTQPRADRHGRILRYVTRAGKDLNRSQVARGWATVQVRRGDPFKRVATYRGAQRSARADDRGIWRRCR